MEHAVPIWTTCRGYKLIRVDTETNDGLVFHKSVPELYVPELAPILEMFPVLLLKLGPMDVHLIAFWDKRGVPPVPLSASFKDQILEVVHSSQEVLAAKGFWGPLKLDIWEIRQDETALARDAVQQPFSQTKANSAITIHHKVCDLGRKTLLAKSKKKIEKEIVKTFDHRSKQGVPYRSLKTLPILEITIRSLVVFAVSLLLSRLAFLMDHQHMSVGIMLTIFGVPSYYYPLAPIWGFWKRAIADLIGFSLLFSPWIWVAGQNLEVNPVFPKGTMNDLLVVIPIFVLFTNLISLLDFSWLEGGRYKKLETEVAKTGSP